MKQQMEYQRQMEAMLKKGGHGTSSLDDTFSVSQAEKSDKQQSQMEGAVDIKVWGIPGWGCTVHLRGREKGKKEKEQREW